MKAFDERITSGAAIIGKNEYEEIIRDSEKLRGIAIIDKYEYEELVRDSEKLRCIETMAMNPNFPLYRDTILAVCGRDIPEVNNGGLSI